MKLTSNNFIPESEIAIQDKEMQASVRAATTTAYQGRVKMMFEGGEKHGRAVRRQAARAKRRALHKLPDLLERAEAKLQANGAEVLWAIDAQEANRHVRAIVERHGVHSVVKSKSMVSEEIGLNEVLERQGVDVVETDLGEFILQMAKEPPSHIVTPVIHKSKASIRKLFEDQLAMPSTDDTEAMAGFSRKLLREKFLRADMGVTGGNFIIAETGTLCLVTNEGNARLVTTLPPVHVAIVGIEKIVETLEDYATLTQVLTRSATGQAMTVYTHMYSGTRSPQEADGPEHMYVIFVDNGRSEIYGTKYHDALACIRCGACMNACPVYRAAGGHAYGWVYPGPIGAVITPLLNGLAQAKPLPHASSLCGACKEVCPVDIDLPRMLLDLRADLYSRDQVETSIVLGLKLWSVIHQQPRLFEMSGRLVRILTGDKPPEKLPGLLGGWTKHRTFPPFAKKSFRRQWRERRTGP